MTNPNYRKYKDSKPLPSENMHPIIINHKDYKFLLAETMKSCTVNYKKLELLPVENANPSIKSLRT